MRRARAGRLAEGVPLGRLVGVPLRLELSWLPLAAVLTVGYARLLHPAAPQPLRYALAGALVLALAGSVLLHEFGHALACRRYGIGVRRVTLDLLGGYTEMDGDPPGPR